MVCPPPSVAHLLYTFRKINSSEPKPSCRPALRSHRDGCLLEGLQSCAFCPLLDQHSTLIAIKSCSGSPVTFPLSRNQSGRELMCPGHRLSISLTHTSALTVTLCCALTCAHISISSIPSLHFIAPSPVSLVVGLSVGPWISLLSDMHIYQSTDTYMYTHTLLCSFTVNQWSRSLLRQVL